MNTEFEPLPWPDNFADWLRHRNEPESLKAIAYSAIDSFRAIVNGAISRDGSLDSLYLAACHPRFVVWDVALALLAKLGESDKHAREKIVALSHESKAELRRRSILYLNDRYSRSYCVRILSRLLTTDRSPSHTATFMLSYDSESSGRNSLAPKQFIAPLTIA